ncbi:MAG TPA: DUF1573 domain-containing protein [Pirellulales bacterium]|nr:DUF1573 domain-containing protein [Pirellulales bacterium]
MKIIRYQFTKTAIGGAAIAVVTATLGGAWLLASGEGRPRADAAQPRAVADRQQHDFKRVEPSEVVSTEFHVRNTGTAELRVASIDKSCGCTSAELATRVIAPQSSSDLTVTFSAPPHEGLVSHVVTLHTNDASNPLLRFVLSAGVRRAVEVEPSTLFLGVVAPGSGISRMLEVFTSDGAPLRVLRTSTSDSALAVEELGPSASWRRRFRLSLTVPQRTGPFEERVEFVAMTANEQVVAVTVRGDVARNCTASPSRLLLGPRSPAASVDTTLVLRSPDKGRRVPITAVEAKDSAWAVLKWSARETNNASLIRMTVRVPDSPGYQKSAVLVRHALDADVVEVPVGCLVQ